MKRAFVVGLGMGLLAMGCGGGGLGGTPLDAASDDGGADGAGGAGDAQPGSPVAAINHPGNGEMRSAGDPVPFVGVATDPQDGALTGAALVWTSNQIAQPIGTGVQFNATLPVGTHVITLTATDSNLNQGTSSINLIMQ